MDQIVAWLDRHQLGAAALVMTVVLLGGASVVIVLARRLSRRWLLHLRPLIGLSDSTIATITRVIVVALWGATILAVLGLWGIGVGGLWTLLVSAAAVVGVGFFATWTMVSNVTASVFIAIWRPFQLGDRVEVLPEGLKGRVVDRNLMFVALREDAGTVIQVPNNQFFQKMIRVGGDGGASPALSAAERDARGPEEVPGIVRHTR